MPFGNRPNLRPPKAADKAQTSKPAARCPRLLHCDFIPEAIREVVDEAMHEVVDEAYRDAVDEAIRDATDEAMS